MQRANTLLSLALLAIALLLIVIALQPGDTGLKAVLLGWILAP